MNKVIPELSEAENIKIMQEVLGVDEVTARFIYDLETGQQDGDALNEDDRDPSKNNKLIDS